MLVVTGLTDHVTFVNAGDTWHDVMLGKGTFPFSLCEINKDPDLLLSIF